jgi:thymidylate synthase
MEFQPLYFADRLTIINPQGTIGVVTLWSRVDYVIDLFERAEVPLDRSTSQIAAFGNLYGNGLREMLRNLLNNPQIKTLLVCGHNRSGSYEELNNFFNLGLEAVEMNLVRYKSPAPGMKVQPCRIKHTKRIIDDLVRPENFIKPPVVELLGDPKDKGVIKEIQKYFGIQKTALLPKVKSIRLVGISAAEAVGKPTVTSVPPLPEIEVQYFPSNPRGHVIIRDNILDAWTEILHLLTRFGRKVTLKKGDRLELQHVKVVVEKPRLEGEGKLKALNLDPQKLQQYQEDILRGEMRADETYNYGHRLRTYFGLDTLAACAERLKKDPEDRKAYVALWDTRRDLTGKKGRPCLVSLFFRKFENKLTLSATFRTHNAMDAWPLNVYGLMAIQNWVAERAGLAPGAITVISHSLGLDPKELDRALMVISKRPFKVRLDPMGYFRITLDGKEILVEHRFEDVTLKEYRGKKAERLQHEIARDVALSDINHAIYLGRQLAKAEMALKEGREFVQD